jgi:hypothetical protein
MNDDEDITEDEIKCPYCEAVDHDSWAHNMHDGEVKTIQCHKCEKYFTCEFSIIILYTTSKKRNEDEE